jgi:hypothetical protein
MRPDGRKVYEIVATFEVGSEYAEHYRKRNAANAKLTAASPSMAEALMAVLKVRPTNWDDGEDPEQSAAWRMAAEALALAGVDCP